MTTIRDDRADLFSKLESPGTQPQYWARVADDVDWTVGGTHPPVCMAPPRLLTRRYPTRAALLWQG
jgi:hypothetical protein